MSPKVLQVVRVAIVVMIVAIVGVTALVVREVMVQDPSTPKTELDRAVFSAEEAVKANPEDPASRVKLAAAYLERGNAAGAIEQGKIALRLDPKDPTAYYVIGLAYSDRDDLPNALKNLTTAAETDGQVAQFYQDTWMAIARVHEKDGKMDRALSAMTKALNFGPENVLLLYNRGQLYERAKDWGNAMDDYGAALEYVPNYQPAADAFARLKKAHPKEFKKLQEFYSEPTATAPAAGK